MMRHHKDTIIGLLAAALTVLVFGWFDSSLRYALINPAPVSGWILFSLILLLTLFNARKKLPFLPLGTAALWLRVHVVFGFVAAVVFGFHTGFRVPDGTFEAVLAAVFTAVTLSGVVGLMLSRWVPQRLTLHGENVLFERIPGFRNELRIEAEQLVYEAAAAAKSDAIRDLYERRLADYFARPHFLVRHLFSPRKPLHALLQEMDGLDRYLSAEEKPFMAKLRGIVIAKNNLDFQKAGQGILKLWLFVHIPLTYMLILLGIVHALLASRAT